MGEYAGYMLNGDDCQECGEYIGEGDGFPRTCAGCAKGFSNSLPIAPAKRTMRCPEKGCTGKFKTHRSYLQHFRDKHDGRAA